MYAPLVTSSFAIRHIDPPDRFDCFFLIKILLRKLHFTTFPIIRSLFHRHSMELFPSLLITLNLQRVGMNATSSISLSDCRHKHHQDPRECNKIIDQIIVVNMHHETLLRVLLTYTSLSPRLPVITSYRRAIWTARSELFYCDIGIDSNNGLWQTCLPLHNFQAFSHSTESLA